MDQVQQILSRIKIMLVSMGFEETTVVNPYRSASNFVREGLYCIPQYVERLGFLIEYANSYEDAQKHRYDDGDVFPLALGEEAILEGLRQEIMSNMP